MPIETACSPSASGTVTRDAAAALRSAPPAIVARVNAVRRAAGLPEIRTDDTTTPMVPPTSSIETRGHGSDHVTAALAGAPAWVRNRVNAARARAGLRTIPTTSPEPAPEWQEPIITIDPRSRLANITRVILIPNGGDAPALAVGKRLGLAFARGAFGDAAAVNALPGLALKLRHEPGMPLTYNGSRLRAYDVRVGAGLALVWDPLEGHADHDAAVQAIERGAGCSVCAKWVARDEREITDVLLVRRARLLHVAIEAVPAAHGSVARVYRGCMTGDTREIERQIEATVKAAEWADRHRRPRG
jgi:hypothetical protein